MRDADLSVQVGGLTFRNPIIPGSSELILDQRGAEKCLEQGVGGIVTKSFTSTDLLRTRPRPWRFNCNVFGKGFENNWIGRGGLHPMSSERAAETLVPAIARLCRNEGVPLIVSIAEAANIDDWVTDARRFEQAGANMLELNFSCPIASHESGGSVGKALGQNIAITTEIIKAIKKAVNLPVSPKLSIAWDPFAPHIKGLTEAGADCFTTHNNTVGMLIDVEEEVPYGLLGSSGYILGRSFLPWSLGRVVETKQLTKACIIAAGGVNQAEDALMYLLVGCSLVEVASAAHRKGYRLFGEIIKGIRAWMERKGYTSINDFAGKVLPLASKVSSPDLISMESPFPTPQEKNSPIIPVINTKKCKLCGKCEDFCLSGVYTVDKAKGVVNIDHENKCWGCGGCVGWCSKNAITLIDRHTNEVVWNGRGLAKPYRPENWKR
ncbi:MAG TPA: tRNA-dihydrouridine synthase [Syntrophorhabdales bacterium]|nr:tRNA-dihydrouridine synthase [Syntrophorhabdales bacterium]